MVSDDGGHRGEGLFWDADVAIRRAETVGVGVGVGVGDGIGAGGGIGAGDGAGTGGGAAAVGAAMTPARAAEQTPVAAPARARMLVLSPDDAAIAAICRTRPGREPYAVLPGGGLEPEDADPLAGALRELAEETGLTGDDVDLLTSSVVVEGEQWIFLGRARRAPVLHLGGPETSPNAAVHGTYEPVWLRPRMALEALGGRVHPDWITGMIAGGR